MQQHKLLKFISFSLLFLLSIISMAQPKKGTFIMAKIGLGITAPDDETDASGSGFYAQGEYVYGLTKWVGLRPYIGFITTSPFSANDKLPTEYKVTSKGIMLGGKARILAPIPYVAPYFELGVGLSAGSFQTFTPKTNINKTGVITHIPFSIGLAIGRKHNFDVGFTYYYQSSVDQFSGAGAFGFTFPLDNK